jgi:hypothetical protein
MVPGHHQGLEQETPRSDQELEQELARRHHLLDHPIALATSRFWRANTAPVHLQCRLVRAFFWLARRPRRRALLDHRALQFGLTLTAKNGRLSRRASALLSAREATLLKRSPAGWRVMVLKASLDFCKCIDGVSRLRRNDRVPAARNTLLEFFFQLDGEGLSAYRTLLTSIFEGKRHSRPMAKS